MASATRATAGGRRVLIDSDVLIWLMRGNAAKAREHLGELARLCRSECEEYRDLERAIAEFERGDRPGKAAGQ